MPIGTDDCTAEYLRFHALRRSGALALVDHGREVTFGQFHRDLRKFALAVRRFGLSAGEVAAIACGDLYTHWLLLLAFEEIGAVTVSFLNDEPAEIQAALFRHVNHVVSDQMPAGAEHLKFHHLTSGFLNDIFFHVGDDSGEFSSFIFKPEDTVRLFRSSGSSGGFKLMAKSKQVKEREIYRSLLFRGSANSRMLLASPFTVEHVYERATACIRMGNAPIFVNTGNAAAMTAKYNPTAAHFLPSTLAEIVATLPPDFRKPEGLTVYIGGAALSATLRNRALDRFATEIISTYSANEMGRVCEIDVDGVCTPLPGVRVEIVGDDLRPVPFGETGRIKVKSASVTGGYLNGSAAMAGNFDDGWFCTDDLGMMVNPGQFRVLGRRDEMLNVGGVKLSPEALEETLRGQDGVKDVAVTSIANVDGIEEICIAIVRERTALPAVVADRVSRAFETYPWRIHTRFFDKIPRTTNGKVHRAAVRAVFAAPDASAAAQPQGGVTSTS